MREFIELGIKPDSGTSETLISSIETNVGFRFPDSFRRLMSYSNEPMPKVGVFEYESGQSCISEFLKFSDNATDNYGILNTLQKARCPKGIIPFAREPGDFLICFDFSSGQDHVVLFDPFQGRSYFVARSFDAFLDSLHE